ncbi:MAG: RagB/SusD family nutrient uptake outer membrane protein [Prolixibacteraceae bacterium]
MKKLIYIILVSVFWVSCSEDFLNLAPVSDFADGDFYNTEEDITQALTAAYDNLQGVYGPGENNYNLSELRSDNVYAPASVGHDENTYNIDLFMVNSTNDFTEKNWDKCYHGIYRCNVVLDRIGDIEMSDNLKNQYIGEALTLRAIQYFRLVRLFGDLPFLTTFLSIEDSYEMSRTKAADILAQLIVDLETASEKLPESYENSNKGRVTKGAAQGLLGKILVYSKEYSAAKDALGKVISSGNYKLLSDLVKVYSSTNKNNEEILFSVQYSDDKAEAEFFTPRLYPKGGGTYEDKATGKTVTFPKGGAGYCVPTKELINAFEPGDKRKDYGLQLAFTNSTGQYIEVPFISKFRHEYASGMVSGANWPILRYAEVLLLYAEALNETGDLQGAIDNLNKVRSRAGLANLSSSNIGNQAACREAIYKERRVELMMEGDRWFDLVRTGKAIETMAVQGFKIDDHQLIYPLPQSAIDVTNNFLEQNPGY